MDRNKRITKPKYEIIKEALLERIRTGQFSSDAVFCTEKMLSEQYEVSRITAKRAIEDLEQQGILYRKRGVGSFVSQKIPPVSSSASETDSKSKMVSLLLPFATTQGNISETIGSLSAATAVTENRSNRKSWSFLIFDIFHKGRINAVSGLSDLPVFPMIIDPPRPKRDMHQISFQDRKSVV